MALLKSRHVAIAAVIGASLGLSACTQSQVSLSPDFGRAIRQDMVAQIADPDARYLGTPAPGSSGPRVGLAQKRYDRGQVIQPSTITASSKGSAGAADNGAAPMEQAATIK